jgi:hypothetical protein
MIEKTENGNLITRYFFGELNEEEESRIELQFLTDARFFEQMLSVEEALIDDYVRGQLPESERKKVEEFLQSSRRLEREINLVERLIGDLAKTKSTEIKKTAATRAARPSFWRSLLVFPHIQDSAKRVSFAFLLLLAAFGLGLAIWNQHKLSQIETKHAELEKRNQELEERLASQGDDNDKLGQRIEEMRRKNDQLEQEVAALNESRSKTSVNDYLTLALTMQAFTRGAGGEELKVVRIGAGTKWLEIKIDTGESDFKSYNAKIETFEGRLVWSKDDLKPSRANPGRISITLQASIFSNEDYNLTLKGLRANNSTAEIGYYSFRVKK